MVCTLRIMMVAWIFVVASACSKARAEVQAEGVSCPSWFRRVIGPSGAEVRRARVELDKKIAMNLQNPPTRPVRTLRTDEVVVLPMHGGRSFNHKYSDHFGLDPRTPERRSIGNQVTFKDSQGRAHQLEIVGSGIDPMVLREMTDAVLRLPADALEATKHIELQGFARESDKMGYAGRQTIVLQRGLKEGPLRHEFGHNLAAHVWGREKPYVEWQRAFAADGGTYVSKYAANSARDSFLAEDFAVSVEAYLRDVRGFRREFPNRAALLDTILHQSENGDASAWVSLSAHYRTIPSRVARVAMDRPGEAAAVVLLGASTAGGLAAAYFVFEKRCPGGRCRPEVEPRLSPTPGRAR